MISENKLDAVIDISELKHLYCYHFNSQTKHNSLNFTFKLDRSIRL